MVELQFKSLKMKPDLFDDYYRDTCLISKSNMITFLQKNSMYSLKESFGECAANIYILVGGKENYAMRKSAAIIQKNQKMVFCKYYPICIMENFQ